MYPYDKKSKTQSQRIEGRCEAHIYLGKYGDIKVYIYR